MPDWPTRNCRRESDGQGVKDDHLCILRFKNSVQAGRVNLSGLARQVSANGPLSQRDKGQSISNQHVVRVRHGLSEIV